MISSALEAILVIPTLSAQLEQVARNTASLPQLSVQLDRVVINTDHLSLMSGHTAALVENTRVLPQTHSELLVMRAGIVQMQADTASMASDVSRLVILDQAVPALVPMLEAVEATVGRLAEVAEPLQGAAVRVGRLTDRLPKRGTSLNGR